MARLIDADALIAEYDRVHIGPAGGARKLMVDAPTVDAVHRETLAQVMWERDVAMKQLEEHGIPFGCKADVQAVVRCKDCINRDKKGVCEKFRQRYPFYPEDDFYCSHGERKVSE